MTTAEFSKFAGILSVALSQHHLLGFEIAQLEFHSPPLTLFVVMLPKANLTSHSKMSGFRWVITPSWLSGSWRSFLYSSSVYSCHLFLISFASVRSIPFLSFIVPIFAWKFPLVSLIFLKRSLVFPACVSRWNSGGRFVPSGKQQFLMQNPDFWNCFPFLLPLSTIAPNLGK